MSRLAAFALGAAVTAVAAALFFGGAPAGDGEAERFRQRAYEAEARIAELRDELARLGREKERLLRQPVRPEVEPPPATARQAPAPMPMPEPSDPRLDPAWNELLSGALRSQVQERLGRELTPEQEQRLMERLDAVRRAGIALDRDEPTDPAARRQQSLTRSIVLLEADRTFRNELGIGLGEFMQGLDEDALVEDLGEAPAEEPGDALEEVGAPVEAF